MHFITRHSRLMLFVGLVAFSGMCYQIFAPHNYTVTVITKITQAEKVFIDATRQDLFVFDIDFTIEEPMDPVFQVRNTMPPAFNGSYTQMQLALIPLFNDLFGYLSKHNALEKMYETFPNKPAEPETILFIKNLLLRGIPTMCLTARTCGEKTITMHELNNLGLDFAFSFSLLEPRTFGELAQHTHNHVQPDDICYEHGVFFAGPAPKGRALKAFLAYAHYRPARIFFFDDHRKNSNSVLKEMKKLGIPTHCFAYFAKRVRSTMAIDLTIVKKQFAHIKEHEQFIGYEEAKSLPEEAH